MKDTAASPRPVRIAVVADHFHPAKLPAEARINTETVYHLVAKGHEVHLFCSRGASLRDGIEGVTLDEQDPRWGLRTLWSLARKIARGGYDDVILMYYSGSFGKGRCITLLPLLLRYWHRFKGVLTSHFTNAVQVPFSRLVGKGLRGANRTGLKAIDGRIGALSCSDRLVFYCEEHRSFLLRQQPHLMRKSVIAPAPLTIDLKPIPNDSPTALRRRLGLVEDKPLVLFFGLVYPIKGIEFLLRALYRLKERGVEVQAAIIGQQGGVAGSEDWRAVCRRYWDEMQALTEELDLVGDVRWLGHVDEKELPSWFGSASVACFPFTIGIRANNSSFTVCAAYGLPVITTDGEHVDAIFREPENGVRLVPRKRGDLLADAIEEVVSDTALRERMGQEIQGFYRRYFDWNAVVEALHPSRLQTSSHLVDAYE